MSTVQPISVNPVETPYPIQDLGSLGGTPAELYDRGLTLVEIFSKLCNLPDLILKSSFYGHTDCKTFVAANFEDPEAYLTLEHEISHIFFDSDLALGQEYNKQTTEDLLKKAGYSGLKDPKASMFASRIQSTIHNIWNCLEDWRVQSLWWDLYPGGATLLKKRWNNVAEHCLEDAAKENLISYIARRAATGLDLPEAPKAFRNCDKHIDHARSLVEKTDKVTCLAVTHQLIQKIAQEIMDACKVEDSLPNNNSGSGLEQQMLSHAKDAGLVSQAATDLSKVPQNRIDGLTKVVSLAMASPNKSPSGDNGMDPTNNPMGGSDIDEAPNAAGSRVSATSIRTIKRLKKIADLAEKGDTKAKQEFEKMAEDGTEKMKKKISDAKKELFKALSQTGEDEEDKAAVEYEKAAAAAGIPAVVVDKTQALPKPSSGAGKVRQELDKIRMSRKRRLFEEGDDIDIEEYISAKINNEIMDAKIFIDTTSERGLDLLVLTDCSGSMYGEGIDMVDQAMADIQEAVKNLKVKTHLWAFSTELYLLKRPGSVRGLGGGGTDLIPALDAALEWARQSKSDRGIIMLTDGYPTSCRKRKSTGNPQQDMADVIKEAQNEGIVISILCINEYEYILHSCTVCNDSAWYPRNQIIGHKCRFCAVPIKDVEPNAFLDQWFGKGNYAVVADKAAIKRELPKCARVLVENHINKRR